MRHRLPHLLFPLIIGIVFCANGQKIASLEIKLEESHQYTSFPIHTNLDNITMLADSLIDLVEVIGNDRKPVVYQIHQEGNREIYWNIESKDRKENKRFFEIINRKPNKHPDKIQIENNGEALVIGNGERALWQYNYSHVPAPEGVDKAYGRSGFIHPMYSPNGHELTRIQPADHYHHYGIWNPWTLVEFEGKTVDFWNLSAKQGTVRFANILSTVKGPVFAEYSVLQEHVVFEENQNDKVALNEVQSVRIFQPDTESDFYIADFTIQMNCATDSEFKIKEYRYAGLGWRTTEKWHRENSETITSEGKNRKEADGTTARWCIVQGELDGDYAGVVMMSAPTNYNHPEPLRIWPDDIYDRGDLFAMFAPTKNTDWNLKPGRNYVLNYRFLVAGDKISPEQAENAWQSYAKLPAIKITKE